MKLEDICTFEQFRDYLAGFQSWADDPTYDVGGVIILFVALLDNLRDNDGEVLEIVGGYLNREQKVFLSELAKSANQVADDD